MKKLILFLAFVAACYGQAQPVVRLAVCADAGANDTYTCTAAPTVTSYTGLKVLLTVNTANTGAATLNIDAVGAKTIHKISGGITTTLADNDLVPKGTYILVYNATDDDFKVISAVGAAAGGGSVPNGIFTMPAGVRNAASNVHLWGISASGVTITTIGTAPSIQSVPVMADTGTPEIATNRVLPPNWTSTTAIARVFAVASSTNTGNAIMNFSTACVAATENPASPSYNTADTPDATVTGPGSTTSMLVITFTGVPMTNCAAGELIWFKLSRLGDDGGDTGTFSLNVIEVEFEFSRN